VRGAGGSQHAAHENRTAEKPGLCPHRRVDASGVGSRSRGGSGVCGEPRVRDDGDAGGGGVVRVEEGVGQASSEGEGTAAGAAGGENGGGVGGGCCRSGERRKREARRGYLGGSSGARRVRDDGLSEGFGRNEKVRKREWVVVHGGRRGCAWGWVFGDKR